MPYVQAANRIDHPQLPVAAAESDCCCLFSSEINKKMISCVVLRNKFYFVEMIDRMKPFGSINQFKSVIKQIRDEHDYQGKDPLTGKAIRQHTSAYPTHDFHGTVKLHGTNGSVVKYSDNHYEFQSRQKILSAEGPDNYRFREKMLTKPYQLLFEDIEFKEYCAVFGEWCGRGVQQGVGISSCDQMFVVFAIKVDDHYIQLPDNFIGDTLHEAAIYSILQFKRFTIRIDFNFPQASQNTLHQLTMEVEEECPVARYFGVEGGIGEGIVWKRRGASHRFKTKGPKHASTKVTTIAKVDEERLQTIATFIEYAVTENRLNQGLDFLRGEGLPMTSRSTGAYLRWVVGDVLKEETETMEANGFTSRDIGGALSKKAKEFWFNYLG